MGARSHGRMNSLRTQLHDVCLSGQNTWHAELEERMLQEDATLDQFHGETVRNLTTRVTEARKDTYFVDLEITSNDCKADVMQ